MKWESCYKDSINSMIIPELTVMEIRMKHREQKRRFHRKILVSMSCATISAASISSISVYAYGIVQREIRHVKRGYLVEGSGKSSEGNTYHNYEVPTNNGKLDRAYPWEMQPYEEEETGIHYYSSWQEATATIPYQVVYPDIDDLVSIAVQLSDWFLVEAVYDIGTDQELSILYRFFLMIHGRWRHSTMTRSRKETFIGTSMEIPFRKNGIA